MEHVKDFCAKVSGGFRDAERTGDADSYARLAGMCTEFESQLREHIQETTRGGIEQIVKKLETDEEMAQDELELVRSWVVGDAESYMGLEHNVMGWLSELRRIVDELNRVGDSETPLRSARHVRALLRDGIRILWDIHHYLEQKERVQRFDETTRQLDREERDLLRKVLKSKLASREF